jgi:hypothetical protein
MGVIDDMLKALDRIPGWARLQVVPNEVDELKRRVTALEDKLGGKWPADVCRHCGERAARLGYSRLEKNIEVQRWDCEKCGDSDFRHQKVA